MNYRRSNLSPFLLGTLGLLLLLPHRGLGQGQLSQMAELKDAVSKGRSQMVNFTAGTKTPGPADAPLFDTFARWYVHRFTDSILRGDPTSYGKKAADLLREFDQEIVDRAFGPGVDKRGNKAFIEMIGPALVKSMRPVFQDDILAADNRMVQVTAATLLPRMARLKQDDIGNYLVELVKDTSKHEAIRLYAVTGLREFPPARFFDDIDVGGAKYEKMRDRDVARVDALVAFIEGAAGKEMKNDPLVVRYLRREALEALAQAQMPAVAAIKRDGKARGAVAPTLLKALTKTGMQPETGIQEKIAAALGLAQMRYLWPLENRGAHEYRADLAVYLVGNFIEEFAKAYNAQWANLNPKNPTFKMPSVAWRIQAKKLELAIKDMVANANPSPLQPHIEEQRKIYANARRVETLALPILNDIYQGNQAQQLVPYRSEIQKLRPQIKTPFRTLKSEEIALD
jgi:hypothetical protein